VFVQSFADDVESGLWCGTCQDFTMTKTTVMTEIGELGVYPTKTVLRCGGCRTYSQL
jgi:hypothetical protein